MTRIYRTTRKDDNLKIISR
uniref:Uncharacterized protein n=1 Tax=Anguilla anguilla TaxID=7936 RepID=A0A0E9VNL2_ANGAN